MVGLRVKIERPERDDALAQRVNELMADGEVRTLDEIADAVGIAILDDDDATIDAIVFALGLDDPHFEYLLDAEDGAYVDLRPLLAGRVFTYRLALREEDGFVLIPIEPDLELVVSPAGRERVPLAGGGEAELRRVKPADDAVSPTGPAPIVLVVPRPWLGSAQDGALLGFSWSRGYLSCAEVEEDHADGDRLGRAFKQEFDLTIGSHNESCEHRALTVDVMLRDPTAFQSPVAPLGAIFDLAGLGRRGDYVGRYTTKWRTPFELNRDERRELHDDVYGFDRCCHQHFDALDRAFLTHLAKHDWEPSVELAAAASHGRVSEAFVANLVGGMFEVDDLMLPLREFATALLAASPDAVTAGPHFLMATAYDFADDSVSSAIALAASLDDDPEFEPALADAAVVAEERGEVTRALEYLRLMRVGSDDKQLKRLRGVAAWSRSATGRNSPCPCGSGRKYKVCCLGRELPPLIERAQWLYAKAHAFTNRPLERGAVLALAVLGDPDTDDSSLIAAINDPLISDVALFEEGQFERFLDVRGPLLPADELELGQALLETHRGLHEVVAVHPARGLDLRDTRDASVVMVSVRGDLGRAVGDLILGRVVAIGDEARLVGPAIPVALRLRESLLELTGDDSTGEAWMSWRASIMAPPEVRNTEGEALVFHTARYEVNDEAAAKTALSGAFEGPEEIDGEAIFQAFIERDGQRWIRATVRISGGVVELEANSDARFERARAAVEGALPEARLIDVTGQPLAELLAEREGQPPVAVPERELQLASFALCTKMPLSRF